MTIHTLSVSSEKRHFSLRCDALAHEIGQIMVCSAAGPHTSVQAVSAALQSTTNLAFSCHHPITMARDYKTGDVMIYNGKPAYMSLRKHYAGYKVYRHKIGFDTWHMLAIARAEGLLTSLSDETLWQALRADKYTTPLLRAWLPHISAKLLESKALVKLPSFGCEAALLRANNDQLDVIVSDGIWKGKLEFAA